MRDSAEHILVVEDEPVTRAKLAGYFEAEGYRVSEAADGEEMWRRLSRDWVDLVLLDINLPGEDGLYLTRRLRARFDIGIILVTGRTDEVDRIVGLEIGADDYVTKPFNQRELLARVKNLLRRAAAARSVDSATIRFGDWEFDLRRRRLVAADGGAVPLTRA
ncbi:MAG: response regulator, partial [Planctomycetota bacterium]